MSQTLNPKAPFEAPTVDRLSIRVVVDSAYDLFAPKLILGISDEISEVGEIEKVEAISELVDEMCGLAA